MSYTVTKNGKTYTEVVAEINARTVDGYLGLLIERIAPGEPYSFVDPEIIDYANLIFDNIPKPSLATFESELASYKTEAIAAETAWFDYEQRSKDWTARAETLRDFRAAYTKAGETASNPAILLKEIIDADDEPRLAAIEAQDAAVIAEFSKNQKLVEKANRMSHGLETVALISYLMDEKLATEADVTALMSDPSVQAADAFLRGGALATARTLIAGLDMTPFLLDESDRTVILAKIDAYQI